MPLWDQLKTKASEMSSQLKTKAKTFKNTEFANAPMAVCALIAAADGSIDSAERQKTAGFISANDVLSMFPADQLRTTFDKFCSKLKSDFDFGKVEAIQTIGKLKRKPDQARGVIQVGISSAAPTATSMNTRSRLRARLALLVELHRRSSTSDDMEYFTRRASLVV